MTTLMQHPAIAPSEPCAPVENTNGPPHPALPCPCGRDHPLVECCLPVAQRLRRGAGGRPSPFDELRATSALLMWGLLSREASGSPVGRGLSLSARRFWCSASGSGPGVATAPRAGADSPRRAPDLSGITHGGACGAAGSGAGAIRNALRTASDAPGSASYATGSALRAGDAAYGRRLFERTWSATDDSTLTWLLASLPAFVRDDPLLGELAIDWLLWDHRWIRNRPGAHWIAGSQPLARRSRVRQAYDAILRSRIGLWRLEEYLPRRGFRLADRLTGEHTLLHTESSPWPDAQERLLMARIYTFGSWHLLAGRCLLLDPVAVDGLLSDLHTRAAATGAPSPSDPRWRAWLEPELIPLIARQWVAMRLAPPPPDRYHGTYC